MPNNFDKLFNQSQGDALINALHGIKSSLDANYPLEDINVSVTNVAQTIYPSENYFGINSVNVPSAALQDVSVVATDEPQMIYPGEGYYGINSVNVAATSGGDALVVKETGPLAEKFNYPVTIDANMTSCYNVFHNLFNFNQPLVIPDNVTNLAFMFNHCHMYNQPISVPNTNVTDCTYMFYDCWAFNQPVNIAGNNISCSGMFQYDYAFNCPVDIHSNNIYVASMFQYCNHFNQIFNFPEVLKDNSLYFMFYGCSNLNQPVNAPDSVTHALSAFAGCYNLNSPVHMPNNLLVAQSMFSDCANFNQPVTLPANLYHCEKMFYNCQKFNQPLTFINVNNAMNMLRNDYNFNSPIVLSNKMDCLAYMMANCRNFNQPMTVYTDYNPSSDWSRCNCYGMFDYCYNLNRAVFVYANNLGTMRYAFCANGLTNLYITGVRNTSQFWQSLKAHSSIRLNIHADSDSLNLLKNTSGLIGNGYSPSWTEDVTNGYWYNEAVNVYMYPDWNTEVNTAYIVNYFSHDGHTKYASEEVLNNGNCILTPFDDTWSNVANGQTVSGLKNGITQDTNLYYTGINIPDLYYNYNFSNQDKSPATFNFNSIANIGYVRYTGLNITGNNCWKFGGNINIYVTPNGEVETQLVNGADYNVTWGGTNQGGVSYVASVNVENLPNPVIEYVRVDAIDVYRVNCNLSINYK